MMESTEAPPRTRESTVHEAELGGVRFTVTHTRHEAGAASAAWRKPQVWHSATIRSVPDGAVVWTGGARAHETAADILERALTGYCAPCRARVPVWRFEAGMDCCIEHAEAIATERELELAAREVAQ